MAEITDNRAAPVVMEEDEQFLNEVCTVLKSVGSNLHNFVEDCSTEMSLAEPESGDTPGNLISRTLYLKDDVASLLGPVAMLKKEKVDELDEVQNRYDELHRQWLQQRDELGRAQDEIIRLRNQVMHQSTFCASLGAVLGNLVWQASRFPQVIGMWLSRFQTKIGEFLCIVNGTFVSYLNTYGSVFPSENSDESQFVMGLCGIVTNISASPEGRQFLVTHPNGKDLLQKIVKLLPLVPLPTGRSLARLMLMILYNVSINQAGLEYLTELRVCRTLGQYIDDSGSLELKELCLHLLQSITFELRDALTIEDILKTGTTERIEELSRIESEAIANTAKEVLSNLKKSRSFLDQKSGIGCVRKDPDSQRYEAKTHLMQSFYAHSNLPTQNINMNH